MRDAARYKETNMALDMAAQLTFWMRDEIDHSLECSYKFKICHRKSVFFIKSNTLEMLRRAMTGF